jgi:hypothetical protein
MAANVPQTNGTSVNRFKPHESAEAIAATDLVTGSARSLPLEETEEVKIGGRWSTWCSS